MIKDVPEKISGIFKEHYGKDCNVLETEIFKTTPGTLYKIYYKNVSEIGVCKILQRKHPALLGEIEIWDDKFLDSEFKKLIKLKNIH